MYTAAELETKINEIEEEIEENEKMIKSNISEEEKTFYLTINSSLYKEITSLTAMLTNISQSVLQAQLQQNQNSSYLQGQNAALNPASHVFAARGQRINSFQLLPSLPENELLDYLAEKLKNRLRIDFANGLNLN